VRRKAPGGVVLDHRARARRFPIEPREGSNDDELGVAERLVERAE
jgi:hypothetical protein